MNKLAKKLVKLLSAVIAIFAVVLIPFLNIITNKAYAEGINMYAAKFEAAADSNSSWETSVSNVDLNERVGFDFNFQNKGDLPAEHVILKADIPEDRQNFNVTVEVSSNSPRHGPDAKDLDSLAVSVGLKESNFRLFYDWESAVAKGDFDGDGDIEEIDLGEDFASNGGVDIGTVVGAVTGGYNINVYFEGYVAAVGDPKLDVVFRAKNASSGGDYGSTISASDGQTVKFLLELHNTVVGTNAKDVKFSVNLPTGYATQYSITADGVSSNAGSDSGTALINFPSQNYMLVYVEDSLKISWDFDGNGGNDFDNANLNDSNLFTSGIGLPDNRDLTGCYEYIAWVMFEMQVHAKTIEKEKDPDIWVDKYVSDKKGDYKDNWTNYNFKAGDKIYFKIEYGNNGEAVAKDVKIEDELPDYLKYDSGDGDYDKDSNTLSFDIGDLDPNEDGDVEFVAKVRDKIKAGCYVNKAEIKSDSLEDKDTAQVCLETEEEKPTELPKAGAGPLGVIASFIMVGAGFIIRKFE